MSNVDEIYADLCRHVLANGQDREDRTGTGTRGVFGYQMRFNLQKGFPLLSTKKVFFKGVKGELLWLLSGSTNVHDLNALGITIWDEWADERGELGPVYGKQWRNWTTRHSSYEEDMFFREETVDQIAEVIQEIKTNPNSRRLIVSAWNVADIPDMHLPPCHTLFQFYVQDGKLSCQLYQRSADIFLGLPFNIASYALLTHLIAQACNLQVGEFIHTLGDAHIYKNHIPQIHIQLDRDSRPMPLLVLNNDIKNIDDFKMEDIKIENYNPHPPIKGAVSI